MSNPNLFPVLMTVLLSHIRIPEVEESTQPDEEVSENDTVRWKFWR